MCAQIIEARVKQKKDTLANWEANPMILLDGEQAFVVSDSGQPVNFKIGDGTKRFSELPYWIDYAGGQYIQITGNVLPEPTVDVGYSLVGPGTYTFAGQPDIVAPDGRLSQLLWDGSSWSLVDMGPIGVQKTDVVEESNTDAVESDAVWRSLDKRYINKGKAYPLVNQPTENIFGVRRMNRVLLDCCIDEVNSGDVVYALTLIARESTSGNWGNGLNIRAYNKSDLSFITSLSLRSTDSELSAENLRQLNKISEGGLQNISLKIPAFGNRTFNFLIDSDEIASGEIVDASYTDDSINMYLSPSVFRKIESVPDVSSLATKTEVQPLSDFVNNVDALTINKGKEYPLINYPTDPALSDRVSLLKNIILDAKVYTNRNHELYYYVGAVYKNHTTNGYGLFICRRYKDGGAVGNMRIATLGEGAANLDQESIDKLQLWENGGIQRTSLKVLNVPFGIDRIEVLIDLDATPEGFTQFGFNDNDRWAGNDFHSSVYHKAEVESVTESINSFDTFKEALQAGQTGIVKVGSMMANSTVDTITFSGNNSSYYPSQVWSQYRIINSSSPSVGRRGEVITIKNEDGTDAVVKSFGKVYTYFGTPNVLYRTKQAFDERVVTNENTKYEKLLIPRELPGHTNEASPTFRVFELDNGELLLEIRNGVKEDPESDYRGFRRQLYVTTGMKNAVGVENENGVLEIDLTGMLTRVHQFKAETGLDYDTTVSIVGRRIALSPYGLGLTGLVHYSNDYGLTWKVIFNMGVEFPEFSVPYKGSAGAWPRPEDLNPPMPAEMWTAGGNTNFHCHGVTIDPFMENRIWVSTGDAMSNHQGRTALWYTDDEGETWTRMQVRGANVLDSQAGLQPMGVVCTKDYVLVGSDSATDGLYRWARSKKTDVPKLEAAWWHNDSYNVAINVIYGGSVVTKEGYIYSVFHPNSSRPDKGVVVFTSDGLLFEEVYLDEARDEPGSPMNINWGSYMGQDRFGNVYVANANGTIIRLY